VVLKNLRVTAKSAKGKVKAPLTKNKNVAKRGKGTIKGSSPVAAASAVAPPSKGRKKKASDPEPPPVPAKKAKKPRKGAFTLSPKPFVTEYRVDPTFESNEPIPFISPMFQGKLLIRAAITQEKGLLQKLTQDKTQIYSFCVPRSVNVDKTAADYALRAGDLTTLKFLMDSKVADKLGPYSEWLIEQESTGRGSHLMFGHGMRAVTAARGGKEGNAALLRDKNMYNASRGQSHFRQDQIIAALESGIKISTLEKLSTLDKDCRPYFFNTWFGQIVHAVRAGQNELAGQLVEMAIKKGGFGFNLLHQEALTKNKKSPLSPFKPISVPKKALGNARLTPIHCAAANPDPYCLTTLLNAQPDFSILDANNWTPMHYAAGCSGPGPLTYLLSRGLSTSMIEKEGNTPLHLAARYGRSHNVKLLLEAESKASSGSGSESEALEVSSLTRVNKGGQSPLHIAAKFGHRETVKILLTFPGVDGNRQTSAQFDKLTPLMLAAQQGHLDVVKELVGGGVKLEVVDKKGRSALTHAVLNGHAHVVSFLLRHGDNHLVKDTSGNTLVHYAAAYGWYFNFKLLVEAGCCPNESNQWKMTPIAIAFMKGHIGLVEILLKEPGVDVNSPIDDSKGTCPISIKGLLMTIV
jgi:ankyrin repeat protein